MKLQSMSLRMGAPKEPFEILNTILPVGEMKIERAGLLAEVGSWMRARKGYGRSAPEVESCWYSLGPLRSE